MAIAFCRNRNNNAVYIKYRTKNPYNFHAYIRNTNFPNFPHQFSFFAAIRLFISSHNEIIDFCSMDKKTGRRYVLRTKKLYSLKTLSRKSLKIRKRRLKKGVFCIFSLMFFNPDDNFFKHYCEFFSCKFAYRVVHFFCLSFNKSDFCHCDDSISAPCRQCVEVFV